MRKSEIRALLAITSKMEPRIIINKLINTIITFPN